MNFRDRKPAEDAGPEPQPASRFEPPRRRERRERREAKPAESEAAEIQGGACGVVLFEFPSPGLYKSFKLMFHFPAGEEGRASAQEGNEGCILVQLGLVCLKTTDLRIFLFDTQVFQ